MFSPDFISWVSYKPVWTLNLCLPGLKWGNLGSMLKFASLKLRNLGSQFPKVSNFRPGHLYDRRWKVLQYRINAVCRYKNLRSEHAQITKVNNTMFVLKVDRHGWMEKVLWERHFKENQVFKCSGMLYCTR